MQKQQYRMETEKVCGETPLKEYIGEENLKENPLENPVAQQIDIIEMNISNLTESLYRMSSKLECVMIPEEDSKEMCGDICEDKMALHSPLVEDLYRINRRLNDLIKRIEYDTDRLEVG